MTDPLSPRPNTGSTLRLLIGGVLTFSAILLALVGFIRLISVLEGGGYGTPPMRYALVVLGASGALLATGIATLIWEIAKRYESPREPQIGDRQPPR